MARFVVGDDRSQSTLFPERLDEYLGGDNPVWAIDGVGGLMEEIQARDELPRPTGLDYPIIAVRVFTQPGSF